MHCQRFRLKSELTALEPFNAQVRAHLAARPQPPDEATVSTVFLVLDELITNVIKYGHPGRDGAAHEIVVWVCLDAGTFVLKIEDDGIPFDPTAAPPPAAGDAPGWEDRPVGGWGLELVRRTVDAVSYQRDQSKNKLTLRKHFAQSVDGSGQNGTGLPAR